MTTKAQPFGRSTSAQVAREVVSDLEGRIAADRRPGRGRPAADDRRRPDADAAAAPEPDRQRPEVPPAGRAARGPGPRAAGPAAGPRRAAPRRPVCRIAVRGQRHRLRGEVPRPDLRRVPAAARPRRVRGDRASAWPSAARSSSGTAARSPPGARRGEGATFVVTLPVHHDRDGRTPWTKRRSRSRS